MLIGITKSLDKLESHITAKLTECKMQMNELSKEYNELQQDLRFNPPVRGEGDARPEELRAQQMKMNELQNEIDFLIAKSDELEDVEDKEKSKHTFSLNDCLRLGITDDAE